MTKLNRAQVYEKLQEIVAEKGVGYVYEAPVYEDEYGEEIEAGECYYSTPAGEPSCLVGQLIFREFPKEFAKLNEFEWGDVGEPRVAAINDYTTLDAEAGVMVYDLFEEDVLEGLYRVQHAQDYKNTWGTALGKF